MGINVDGEQSLFFSKISEGVWYCAFVGIQAAKPRAGSLSFHLYWYLQNTLPIATYHTPTQSKREATRSLVLMGFSS